MANQVIIKAVITENDIDFGNLDFDECIKLVSRSIEERKVWFETINKKVTAEDVFNNIPSWIGLKDTVQTITGDGSSIIAVTVTESTSMCNATAGHLPVTLADGADGQIKILINDSASADYDVTITPANFNVGTATKVNIDAPGRSVILMFKSSNWHVIGGNGHVIS